MHESVEMSAHHIPSPGTKLHQGVGLNGFGSGMSQTRKRYIKSRTKIATSCGELIELGFGEINILEE